MIHATFGIAMLCVAPQLCGSEASESVADRMERQRSLLFAQRNFTTEKCHETVKEVHKNGKYTEESITPICEREMKWEKCDFFSEALSLSSSHPDFNKTQFCNNMDQAHFCSSSMDSLLVSLPVSDLAYGQCTRAKPKKSDAYCKKFQRMFAYAVQSEDLDTIRACYMIQAYSNMTASQKELEEEPEEKKPEEKPVTPAPSKRIITSSGKELDAAGKGKPHGGEHRTPEGVTKFGDNGIVVQPQPLEDFGSGKGHFVSPNRSEIAAPTPAPQANKTDKKQASTPPPAESGTIIVEPVAATEAFVVHARAAQTIAAVPASPVVEMREVVVQLPASADAAKFAAQLGGQVRMVPAASVQPVTLQVRAPPAKAPVARQEGLRLPSTRPAVQPKAEHAAAHPAAQAEAARPHAGLAQVHRAITTHAALRAGVKTSEEGKGAGESKMSKKGKESYKGFMSGFVDTL